MNLRRAAVVPAVLLAAGARRLGHRSGVTDAQVGRELPGDAVIASPGYVADRAVVLDAPVADVWPWIVQLGRHRAGWYAPSRLERLLVRDRARRGAREVRPELQRLAVGDVLPDWGGGYLRVLEISPPADLVYGGLRRRDDDAYAFTWADHLEPAGDATVLHTRLRARRSDRAVLRLLMGAGGLFDWATIAVMFAGLRERLTR